MKKYEREIAELLNKLDDFIPEDRPRRRRPKGRIRAFIDRTLRSLAPSRLSISMPALDSTSLIIACVFLACVANVMVRIYRPGGMLIGLAAVFCLVAAIALPFFRRQSRREVRWRGQIIELDDYRYSTPSTLQNRARRLWRQVQRTWRNWF